MPGDGRIAKFFPFLLWWPELSRRTLKSDLLAGLTGAVIVLPQGVAFAIIAGLPPQYGLYSAIVPAIVAALFGSSRHLISGPTTAISLVLFSTISRFAEPGSADYIQMVLTLTFLAGMVQLALGSVRLGALVNFISHSVVVGFTAGAAILIATSQIGGMLGVSVPKGHSFIRTWLALFTLIAEANTYVVAVAAATLASALLLRLYAPKLPGMLVAMVLGSFLSMLIDGAAHGVKLVGSLPSSLPPLSSPDLSLRSIRQLSPGALAVAMLGLVEAVSIARSVATRSQQRIDNNQEFIGQGLSNIVGSFFSSYAASGSFTRTGVNYSAGAKTPMSAVFAALSLMAILLLVAPLTAYLPIAAMSGILVLVAFNLIDLHHIKTIVLTSKQEAVVMTVTFLSTLFVELEFAIYIGVLLSLMLYLNRTSHPHFVTLVPDPESDRHSFRNVEHYPTPECPQLKVLRVDGSLFFGAVNHMAEEIARIRREFPEQCHLLVVATGINFIDVAGCEMLAAEARRLHLSGGKLYLCNLKHDVREVLERGGYIAKIGQENVFRSKTEALKEIVRRLDPERCRLCPFRIFHECGEKPGG
jgi:SulP family sulfate permease